MLYAAGMIEFPQISVANYQACFSSCRGFSQIAMTLQYTNKIFVAPMVRLSTLPFRLLALEYGADLVYTEEIVDFKMLRSVKKHNDLLGTVDFVDKTDGTVFFRTTSLEKDRVIFQIGTSDAQRALKVAKMVEPYVSGIDINMGCPKTFSIKGGMGAALLTQPEKVKTIVTTLVQNLKVPVTCKIRILPSVEDTVHLCRIIEETGVAAIAVHGRTKEERPKDKNHNDVIRKIASSLHIPVIANGGSKEIHQYEDLEKFQKITGSSSVMIARAAMWNCSILRKRGMFSLDDVIKSYLQYCIQYDNPFTCTKYSVQNMLRELQDSPRGKAFLETQTLHEICNLWNLGEYFCKHQSEQQALKNLGWPCSHLLSPSSAGGIAVTSRHEDGREIVEMPLQFIRGNFCNADLPKMILNTQINHKRLSAPKFFCKMEEKFFTASVLVNGVHYQSTLREKSRRYAEQAAAFVCLHALQLVDETYGFKPSVGTRRFYHTIYSNKLEKKENCEKRICDEKSYSYCKKICSKT